MNTPCFQESLCDDSSVTFAIKEILHCKKSEFQAVHVLDTVCWGRALLLDGAMQSTESDEFAFHESLVHPVMLNHPNPKTVFVLGGGEGATMREALRYKSVEKVVMVDIDEECVEACKKHMPQLHQGSFDDPRVEVIFADGKKFIQDTDYTFDVMIFDLADPIEAGPAQLLYTKKFYESCKKRLNPGGLIAVQSGPGGILTHEQCFSAIHNTLKAVFPSVRPYSAHVPSFYDQWGFVIASLDSDFDATALTKDEVDRRLTTLLNVSADKLRFLDGTSYAGLFALPKLVRQAMADETRVITEETTVAVS